MPTFTRIMIVAVINQDSFEDNIELLLKNIIVDKTEYMKKNKI